MLKVGGGSIINTASTFGLNGEVWQVSYGTSKAAVIQLTKNVAAHFGKNRIRCNAIAPGLILTPAIKALIPEAVCKIAEDNNLTPYLGEPDDIANAVAFLASDEARYITGHCLAVDGGTLSHLPTSAPSLEWLQSSGIVQRD
jgi:NAD(P)-dependent dehydrogenase (short-subunit alcohol dehydrogenase family)